MAAVQNCFTSCVAAFSQAVDTLFQTFQSYVRTWTHPNEAKWDKAVADLSGEALSTQDKLKTLFTLVKSGRKIAEYAPEKEAEMKETILNAHRSLPENIQGIVARGMFFCASFRGEIKPLTTPVSPTFGGDAIEANPLDEKMALVYASVFNYLNTGGEEGRASTDLFYANGAFAIHVSDLDGYEEAFGPLRKDDPTIRLATSMDQIG